MFDNAFIIIVVLVIGFVYMIGAVSSAGVCVRKANFEICDGFPYYGVAVLKM